jgi:hypothetical protein
VASFDPFKLPESSTAKTWGALLAALSAGGWMSRADLLDVGERAGQHRKTVGNRLDEAVQYGVVVRHGTRNPKTQVDYRQYRLLPMQYAHRNARQWYGPGEGACTQPHKHEGPIELYRASREDRTPFNVWLCERHASAITRFELKRLS